jgi:hypothetical protein
MKTYFPVQSNQVKVRRGSPVLWPRPASTFGWFARQLRFLACLSGLFALFALRVAAQQIQIFNGTNVIANNQTTPVDFGSVQQKQQGPALTFTVTNSGGKTLDLLSITVPSGYTLNTNYPSTIPPGSNGTFIVQLNSSVVGTNSGNIIITNTDPNNSPFSFAVTGIITPVPPQIQIISLSGNLSFGVVGVGSSAQTNLTISNGGNSTLTVSNITYPAGFGGNWPGGPITNGESQSVTVTFSPAAATNYDGTVTVASDATSGADTIPISGFGANDSLVLTVITNGDGAVSPNLNGKSLKANMKHTLTATAKSGNVFSNWTGSITTNKNPLTFTMESGMVLEANFVTNPFLPFVGTYNGLFWATNGLVAETNAGMLKGLTLTSKGTYSGTLLINGASKGFSGSFDLAGVAGKSISLGSKEGDVEVVMTLTSNNPAPRVTGTVSNASWLATNLTADRAANTPISAEYTLLIPPDTNSAPTNSPGGDGYALITNHAGKATITGALADGAAFSQTVPVSQDGYVPIYANLYAGKGLLLGWVNLDLTNTANVSLTWIRPEHASGLYTNGFTNVLPANQIQLSPWTNPPGNIGLMTNLLILDTINDTNTPIPVTITSGKVAGLAVSGTVNLKTGLLKVTLGGGANKTNGYGAILLNATNGGGYFLTKTNAGAVILQP